MSGPGGELGLQGGYCKPLKRVIAIWEALPPSEARRALLHEMCHATTSAEMFAGLDHGPCWRAEMLRLAFDCGDAWAAWSALDYARVADAALEAEYVAELSRGFDAVKDWASALRRA